MKAYLITTGVLFALLSLVHVLRVAAEWRHAMNQPGFLVGMAGLTVLTGLLSAWAWYLLARAKRDSIGASEHSGPR